MTEAGGRAVRIERTFDAPAEAVLDAWTSAEVLRRWFHVAPDWETPEAEVDLRVGGKIRVVMRRPDGTEFGAGGEFTFIPPTSAATPTMATYAVGRSTSVPSRGYVSARHRA